MNISLSGKNVIICGSTQGIGLAIAKELAICGANCFLLARNEALLKKAVSELDSSFGQQHKYYIADFENNEIVKNVIDKITSETAIHILINNTGGPKSGLICDTDQSEFIVAFHQHIINYHNLAKAVLPGMKKDGYGRIINIVSTSVKIPINNLGVSNTIRAATAAWAKTLSNEVAQYNITVNNILPGFINTNRLKSLIAANAKRSSVNENIVEKEMINTIPAKRFGDASEIAAVAAFLASPAASYINGTSIPVDGGKTGTLS